MSRATVRLAMAVLVAMASVGHAAVATEVQGAANAAHSCEFGNEVARGFNERDEALVAKLFDMDVLARRAARSFSDDVREQAGFARGIAKTPPRTLLAPLFKALETSKGVVECLPGANPKQGRALLRFDMGDNGFDYLELVVEREHFVDWYQLSRGELLSVTAGGLGRLMTDPNPGLLQTLFGVKSVDRGVLEHIRAMGTLQRAGKYAEAIAAIDRLPQPLAESRILLTNRAGFATYGQLPAEYDKSLALLAKRHGDDPSAAVMLLDYYFKNNQTARALGAIDAIELRVGVDGLTTLLRANAWLGAGEFAPAIQSAKESIRLEPKRDGGYHTLAAAFIGLKKYPDAVKTYQTLASDFGYRFERQSFLTDATYAGFVKSPEFARWLPK
jgi:tetratricopeptide (TPR) repeat protein